MSWWKRQRVVLTALLIAAVAATGVHLWFDALPASGPETAISVADGATGEIGGHELTVASTRWSEFEAPEGSRTLSVRLDARSDEDAEPCRFFSLAEVDGSRVWRQARGDVDIDYGDAEPSCPGSSASYGILAVFLLPDDAAGPFWFDVSAGDGTKRFRLVP